MTEIDLEAVENAAREELRQERFRAAVEKAKEAMRRERWWHRLFPFHINIIVTRRKNHA